MKREKYYEFVKYLGVGVINTIIGLSAVLILFNIFNFNYWFATALGNLIGIIVSFFLNKRYTFKYNGNSGSSFPKFFLVSLISYIIAYSLGAFISDYMERMIDNIVLVNNLIILFSSGLYTILGFIGHKKITFKTLEES
ncbi:GtrA family protein [Paenibacillus sp. NPDC101420]|uniref:GtrA family protein n=1 Tax=Paenibacillus sp. NPDC101420 TaxID=3390602 RepID=UPI003D08667E